ncbi:dihydroorotase [Granulicatella balaenopterae]|uniref:Dihydroorotase n=1 Tax=Granulicatella balaenopterae TaxID=137733 RepID=A0A1H9NW93_9LACT|nr:amidohydrolase/deacetylase family metallohydrolase [Granulicatella balaenopterae]SER40256.1 dihydroorotase [Granulicatella balaenopterae]
MTTILIKNAKTVNNELIDIYIVNNKIKEVAAKIDIDANQTIDLKGMSYVSAGWIDSHVHCNAELPLYYDSPDEIGYKKGVTTVVDAGSNGILNIEKFLDNVSICKTNVYALLNISESGIVRQDELSDLNNIKPEWIKKMIQKHADKIIGLKARMSASVVGDNDIEPLKLAKNIQKDNHNLPLMVHIGSAPPSLEAILELLDKGDIVTHCFNGKKNGIVSSQNEIKDFVKKAYNKGIIFDIGHGTDSFNFKVAEIAIKDHINATTISTDIYHKNRLNGPVHDMATTLEKLIAVGYDLGNVIDKITTFPAEVLHLANKGKLEAEYDADITIFDVVNKKDILIDSNGNIKETTIKIVPKKVLIGGIVYDL